MEKRVQICKNLVWLMFLTIIGAKLGWAEDIDLERIVVTPSRIEETYGESGRKVDIISSRDLKYLNPKNLSEALEETPSITINDYGSLGAQKTINMRGSTASQVLVLVDGRPINSPRSGDVNFSTISLDNIDRIEVMHGPASSLYGSSAMGGVVNIIAKQPPEKGQKTKLLSSFGTFRTYQEALSQGGRFGNFGYQLNSSYQSSEGHRDNSEFNAEDVNTKLTYALNPENKFTLQGGFYKDKLGTPGKITDFDIDDKQKNLKNFFDLNWSFKPDDRTGLSTKIYQNYDRLEFMENSNISSLDTSFGRATPLDKTIHTTKARGIDLQFSKQLFENYQGICGFNYVSNRNDSTASAKHEYTVRAGYLENQLNLTERFNIDFGARLDDYSNFGTQISPSLNLLYNLNDDSKLHFLLARSFRAPTFNDLYWPLSGGSEGNPNLQPEKGITAEFGIEKKFSKFLKIGLTYFRSDYDKLIKWQEDLDKISRPKNIDSAIIQGVEQELQINPFDNLEIDMGYTFLRAKDDKTGKFLTYQPEHKVNLTLLYKGPAGFNFGLKGEFVDRRFDKADNTISVKRYYVLGLRFNKKVNNSLDLFMNIDNLLDKKYQSRLGYPLPGFSLTGGAKIEF